MKSLLNILKEVRPESEFESSTDYIGEGLLDSFDIVSLVSSLDQHYGISIDGVDILPEHFQSVQAIAALLGKYGVAL